MRPYFTASILALCTLMPMQLQAQELNLNKQSAEELLQKGLNELSKLAEGSDSKKKEKKKKDDEDLWEKSKEHQTMDRNAFADKARKGLKSMEVAIKELEQSGSNLTGRVYFQLRLQSLEKQLTYCQEELVKLSSEVDEASYLAKLKSFDRLLESLSDHIELSQDDAGLR